MFVKIKICGLTNVDDARDASDCGASYLGVIFAENSPRKADLAVAKQIAAQKPSSISLVGVFQNQPLELVNDFANEISLDFVQLHGDESVEYCRAVEKPVIKVISLKTPAEQSSEDLVVSARRYTPGAKYLMFDRPKGELATDWLANALDILACAQADLPPYFFAGGLNVGNLPIVLSRLHPYCLDVASGVERRVGEKDIDVMRAFCELAKCATENINTAKSGG